uniref:Uncharacterized protein n=1 Tax=Denticeps clupeoides TaxID=299321 RepID=A0AAY4CK43_9TELE
MPSPGEISFQPPRTLAQIQSLPVPPTHALPENGKIKSLEMLPDQAVENIWICAPHPSFVRVELPFLLPSLSRRTYCWKISQGHLGCRLYRQFLPFQPSCVIAWEKPQKHSNLSKAKMSVKQLLQQFSIQNLRINLSTDLYTAVNKCEVGWYFT